MNSMKFICRIKLLTFIAFLIGPRFLILAVAKPEFVDVKTYEQKKLRVVFFTGIRYLDGLGDLTLNKYLILDQVAKLKSKFS